MQQPSAVRIGSIRVGVAFLGLLALRAYFAYGHWAMVDDPLAAAGPITAINVGVTTAFAVGVLSRYGGRLTSSVADTTVTRPAESLLLGVGVGGLLIVVALGGSQAIAWVLETVVAIDVAPLTVVVMAAILVVLALATAAGIIGTYALATGAILGYLACARPVLSAYGTVPVMLASGGLAAGAIATPAVGLFLEGLLLAAVLGGALLHLGGQALARRRVIPRDPGRSISL